MSTITVSSAESKNVSGTVSFSGMPVISVTTSFRLSRCCTLIVVKTSMPLASSSSTSFQRLGCRAPGGLAWARSSMIAVPGLRLRMPSRSSSGEVAPASSSKPSTAAFSLPLPCMSMWAMTTSRPASFMRRAAAIMASVLPAPGKAPTKTLSLPRTVASVIPNSS